jgi:hypothetical protein
MYKLAISSYIDTWKILGMPIVNSQADRMSDKEIGDLKRSELKFKIYDNLIHSWIHADYGVGSEVIKTIEEIYDSEKLNHIQILKQCNGFSRKDYISIDKELTALKNDASIKGESKAAILNNLAMAKFHIYYSHKEDAKEKSESVIQVLDYKKNEILPLLKDSIKNYETLTKRSEEETGILNSMLNRDQIGPEEFYKEAGQNKYFKVFQNPRSGLPLTNIWEHLLLQGDVDVKHTSFWFVAGLKFHENHNTQLLTRHLTLLAIFYNTQSRGMIAEGLLSRALELTKNEKSFDRSFALRMYSLILAKKPNRATEVEKFRKEADEIDEQFPDWYKKIVNIQIPIF